MWNQASKSFDPHASELRVRRFWVWHHDSPVRLCLRLGESITLSEGGRTDEGGYSSSSTYHISCGRVVCETHTDSTDCDGRMSSHNTVDCSVYELESRTGPDDDALACSVRWPAWERVSSGQRDYSAEAAGY